MAPRVPRQNLSKPPTSGSTNSGKRSLPPTSSNRPRKSRVSISSRHTSISRSSDQRTPAGTPDPILPCERSRFEQNEEEVKRHDNFDDGSDNVVLAIDRHRKNTIGCSYYVAKYGVLYSMEDMENADEETVHSLKQDLLPTIILLSSRNQDLLKQESSTYSSVDLSGDDDDDDTTLPYKIELRPNADFKYEQALHKLSTLPSLQGMAGVRFLVPGEEEDAGDGVFVHEAGLTDERGRELHISGSINLESRFSIGCAGAIITYLQRRKASEYLSGDPAGNEAYPILRLEMFSLKDVMLVNSDTLAALQIMQPESNPDVAKQGPGSAGAKESLSIYGLFYHFARTPQGKQRLRNMFLHPSLELDVIRERHKYVAIFSEAQNHTALHKLSKSLSKIKNMRRILVMVHKGTEGGTTNAGGIKSSVWSSLLDFCFHVIDLCETLTEVVGIEALKLYRQMCDALDRLEFQRLGKIMFEVVDLDESQHQRRTVIKRGINEDLDRVKDAYDGMDEMLQQAAIETVPELNLEPGMSVPALTVIYLPQLGFHVLVPIQDLGDMAEQGIHLPWERMFTTEKSVYFKTNKTRQMDAELGDIWAMICDIEIEISYDLAQQVLEKEDFLVQASDICGELDSMLALAHGATEYRLTRPRMLEQNLIDIRAGRHLLQELTVPSYVANDAFIVGGSGGELGDTQQVESKDPNMLLLTGPNFSGKSVYLKQVALIVYMAQVGSFVPAQNAQLGITDKIMTRITTRETVSKCQSSFMIDLQQISWALKASTPRSLLVIDEFGEGTDNCDGVGLAAGVFSHLLSQGDQAPKVLASTHFHEIFEQGSMAEKMSGLGLRQMEVQLKDEAKQERSTGTLKSDITYLYNVRPGRSTLSYGAQCAALNGVPEKVVDRACELTKLAMAGEDLVSACSYMAEDEIRDLEQAEQVSRAFFELDLEAVQVDTVDDLRTVLSDLIDQCSTTDTCTSPRTEEFSTIS